MTSTLPSSVALTSRLTTAALSRREMMPTPSSSLELSAVAVVPLPLPRSSSSSESDEAGRALDFTQGAAETLAREADAALLGLGRDILGLGEFDSEREFDGEASESCDRLEAGLVAAPDARRFKLDELEPRCEPSGVGRVGLAGA